MAEMYCVISAEPMVVVVVAPVPVPVAVPDLGVVLGFDVWVVDVWGAAAFAADILLNASSALRASLAAATPLSKNASVLFDTSLETPSPESRLSITRRTESMAAGSALYTAVGCALASLATLVPRSESGRVLAGPPPRFPDPLVDPGAFSYVPLGS